MAGKAEPFELAANLDVERGHSFGPFRLEPDGTLLRGKAVVHLPPKELTALRLLVARAGKVVTSLELRQALWGSVHVTVDSVPRCLSSLRAKLEPEKYIQTVYKRGYRFTATVRQDGGATNLSLPRLAILPFVPGPTVPEHLGAAVAEEAIARLIGAKTAIVSVLARDSVFTLARRELTAHQIGQMLKADLVLTGTLRALPSHFRLRAEMIRVEDGSQIWVEDFLIARTLTTGLEAELAQRLFLRLSAGPVSDGYPTRRPTLELHGEGLAISAAGDPADIGNAEQREAYELYQFAHYEWQTLQRHPMQDAMQRLLRAAELDPSLISAKVDIVRLCMTQASYGFVSPTIAADWVRRTAESIPDIQLNAPGVLPSLGTVSFHIDHDLPTALTAFSLSAHLPHDPWITRARSMFALSRHRFDEAIEVLESALRQDPYAPWLHARLAWALHLAGRVNESLKQIRHSLTVFPGHEGVAFYGAMILPFNGDAEGAVQLAESLSARQPHFDLVLALQANALACAGRKEEARANLERLQWLSRERYVSPSFNAAAYVALGDHQTALNELRASLQSRSPWFFQMLADPQLKPLRAHSEFKEMRAILTRMETAAAN
jgi:DNA-binding winged helix-turn-helix (wHTH) protein/tetratricopeptide (TPR) repeat protein